MSEEASLDDARDRWNVLHAVSRFRPRYPSEPVVRFLSELGGDEGRATRLLDIGCGAGRHLVTAHEFGFLPVGIDASVEGLMHTRRALQMRHLPFLVAAADMTALPFPDGSFDATISYGVLYYSNARRYRAAVEELYRVLQPGGRALVITRSRRDRRFELGMSIEEGTVLLTSNETNEEGMVVHFLDREAIDDVFAQFSSLLVDSVERTVGGGRHVDSDWVINAQR